MPGVMDGAGYGDLVRRAVGGSHGLIGGAAYRRGRATADDGEAGKGHARSARGGMSAGRPPPKLRRVLVGALLAMSLAAALLALRRIDASIDHCVYLDGNALVARVSFDTEYSLADLVVEAGSDEVRSKSQALGAVYVPRALPEDLVDRARADITRQLLNAEQPFSQIALTGFRKEEPLRLTPAIMEVVERTTAALRPAFELLGEDAVIVELTGNFAWPGAQPQRVHDDIGGDKQQFDEASVQLTAFVYLDDIGPKQSPTMFFPDDHHRLIADMEDEEFEAIWGMHKLCEGRHAATRQLESFGVEATVPKGTLALYNNDMMHAGTENLSRRVRPAMVLTYGRSYEQLDATQTWGIDGEYFNRIRLGDVLDGIDRAADDASPRCYPTTGGRVEREKLGRFANLTSAMTLAHELQRVVRLKAQPDTRRACREKLRELCGHTMDEGDSLGCLRCASDYFYCCTDPPNSGDPYQQLCHSGRADPMLVLAEHAYGLRHVLNLVEEDSFERDPSAWGVVKPEEELLRFTRAMIEPSGDTCPLNPPCMWPAIEMECRAVVFSDRPYAQMYSEVRAHPDYMMMDFQHNNSVYVDGTRALLDAEAFYTYSRLLQFLFGSTVRRAYVLLAKRVHLVLSSVLGPLVSLPPVAALLGLALGRPQPAVEIVEGDYQGYLDNLQLQREVEFLLGVDPLRRLPSTLEGLGSPLSLLEFGNYTLAELSRPLEPHEFVPVMPAAERCYTRPA